MRSLSGEATVIFALITDRGQLLKETIYSAITKVFTLRVDPTIRRLLLGIK